MADPILKKQLGKTFQDISNVFDVLISDGQYKMKAVLSPKYHHLIYTREIRTYSIIQVTKFAVFNDGRKDEMKKQRVVLLEDVAVMSHDSEEVQSQKIIAQQSKDSSNDKIPLEFISKAYAREIDLLPLVGERAYYCPLWSDHYTLDWACSFTDGVAEEDSPLDELENKYASCYSDSDAMNGCSDQHKATSCSVVAWSVNPDYCLNLFTSEWKKVFTILEAVKMIMQDKEDGLYKSHPPMLGAIRVKSRLINLGDPDIANPFPFAFNAVVVDANGAFEVMFFGSMCAKYFLSIHEGDLIQFQGYSIISPQTLQWTMTTSPLIYYEHASSGTALHVSQKYWRLLEMTTMGSCLSKCQDNVSPSRRQDGPCNLPQLRSSWLECSFVTTLDTLYWGNNAINSLDRMYFDFIGVLSNVGKIYREPKRRSDEDGPDMTMYRWVKMIDSSSSHELVIRLCECSQPAAFRSLTAGDILMITKLQWIMLPAVGKESERIQYATTSVFSILRVNKAVIPFHSIVECNLNNYFANNVRKNAAYDLRKATGESKLIAHMKTRYCPRNCLPTTVNAFKEAFSLKVSSFSDLSVLLLHMEAYEYQHVGFVGQVSAIRKNMTKNGPSVLLELKESKNIDQALTVAMIVNELYKMIPIKESVRKVTPPELHALVRLLPAATVDDMYDKAVEDRPAESTHPTCPMLSLSFIEKYLTSSNRDYFFSLQLYRDGIGHITWEVDAILAMS